MVKKQIIPDHDTYADHTSVDAIRGNDTNILIKCFTDWMRRPFFKWSNDLIWDNVPKGSKINEAIFYVYVYQADTTATLTNIPILRCASNWNESALTWNNQPGVTGDTITTINLASTGWKSADITSIFKAWYREEENNYGIRVWSTKDLGPGVSYMYSSEATSNKPYIEVDYTPRAGILNWWFFRDSWEKHDKLWKPKILIPEYQI